MARVRRVGIVGAGLAGLATAIAASAAGAQVDVFDSGVNLTRVPAHIDVVPNMIRDLATLGVGEACTRRGFAYHGTLVVELSGRSSFEIPTPRLAGPRLPAALGMVYADLLGVLHEAAVRQGARVHWQSRIERADVHGAIGRLITARGEAWSGDLVVLAGASRVDGVDLPLAEQGHRLPQRWEHVLLPRQPGIDRSTWVIGPGRSKALIVPVGTTRAGIALLRDEPSQGAGAPSTPAELRATLSAAGGMLAKLGGLLDDDSVMVARPVRAGLLPGAWHSGAALRIGSSAHVLPPHFGQAAAQSVEDATVLGELLRADIDRAELLARFMARRADRAAGVHAIALQAARWDLNPEPSTDLLALARRLAPIVRRPA